MPLKSFIRRKLLSLLQPWLREEPELDIQLGFRRSLAVAENIRFDVSVLNRLFDSPSCLFIKELTIEHLTLRFSPWHSAAFDIEVRGVRVVLAFEMPDEEVSARRLRLSKFDYTDYLRKRLEILDPEGCSLHHVLESIVFADPERKDLTSSFLNLIMKSSHLEAHDINMEIQFPIFNAEFMCFGEVKNFSARSDNLDQKCLFRGFLTTILIPVREGSYMLNCTGLRVGFIGKNQPDRALLSSDVHIFITLRDLQLVDCTLSFPELGFSFTPKDVSVFLVIHKLLSDKHNEARSARELWRIAANKIGHMTIIPMLSLQRLVGIIGQWKHYVDAYENLLLLVGYSTGPMWKMSISKMFQRKQVFSSARNNWKVISNIEKKLPVEGISLARRIARHRAALEVPSDCHEECLATSKFVCPFLSVLMLIWKVISKIICCFLNIFGEKIVEDSDIDGCLRSSSKDLYQRCCFVLNFGKIIVRLSQINEIQPSAYEKLHAHTGIAYSDFLPICFCIDQFLLVTIKDNFGQRVFVSCGQMKVEPAPLTVFPEASPMNKLNTDEENGEEGTQGSILWCEPAKSFVLSESNVAQAEDTCDSHVHSFMGKLSASWKGICSSFSESEIEYSENPCLLCKFETSSAYQDNKNPCFGFCEFGFMLGKINLFLTHFSVSSVSLLVSQIQHVCTADRKEASDAPNLVHKAENVWVDTYEYYAKQMIIYLLQKLPQNHFHFGAFVDGPFVRFSLKREAGLDGQDIDDIASHDNFDINFDFHDIEVAVGSPSLLDMSPLTDPFGLDDAKAEYITLEPCVVDIPKPDNDKYVSSGKISIGSYIHQNGLNVYLEELEDKHQIQLLVVKPIIVQILSVRNYIYSLCTTMSAFSASWDITAGGFTVFSFLDEVYMICKAVAHLSSVVSYMFSSSEDVDCWHPEILKQEAMFPEPDSCEPTIEGALPTNNICSFFINGTCRFESMDIILHNSRSYNGDGRTPVVNFLTGNKLAVQKLPDCGIWISIQQTSVVVSGEEEKMDIFTDLAEIISFLFTYQNSIGNNNDRIVAEKLLLQSVDCLHEVSLSGCTFTLCLGLFQNTSVGSSDANGHTDLVQGNNLTASERLITESPHSITVMGSPTIFGTTASARHCFLVNASVTNVVIGRCSTKRVLVEAHQSNKFMCMLSVGGEFQMVSWEIQGGLIALETSSLAMAIDNYTSYLKHIRNLTSDVMQHNKAINQAGHGEESCDVNDEIHQEIVCTSQRTESESPNSFDLSLSHFALVFAHENDSGGIREIILEVDIHLKFESATTGKKLKAELSHLSILSQITHENLEHETTIPHFSSVRMKDFPSQLAFSEFQNSVECHAVSEGSSSRGPVPFHLSHQNQILKDLRASMSLERPADGSLHLCRCWFGIGSISGFDMTLSISEIQTILSMASSVSLLSLQNTRASERNHWSTSHNADNSLEAMIPDGAVVAIQDINQHMYFTVEGEENSFSIGGVIHYSLVGERALFRVKHLIQRRWKSTIMWFSLISLFAKNDMGVPLRLNSSPGSCFVDISCPNDGSCALWRVFPPEGGSYEGVTDWGEACNQPIKRSCCLVNKRITVLLLLLMVLQIQNFHDLSVGYDASDTVRYPRMAPQSRPQTDEESILLQGGKLPRIDINIEKITLHIVHELSDTKDLFPLICLFINNTQLIVQNLATKSRVIGTSTAGVQYYDALRNLWGELLHPVGICIFYRSNIQTTLPEYASHTVPAHFFCRAKELDISLSENSLDVLLFMIGKLNLSGPYMLQSSIILANCCKVENQSGLNLLFHFKKETATIPRKQSASISLRRHSDIRSEDSDAATSVSIQLADFGSFATSSIPLLLSQTQIAWRTRIRSAEGSRTFPGPMIVIKISRNAEVGLSVVVSPLIRIHNETGFPLELQFQRAEPQGDEVASVVLEPGDYIDDSMAMFDAINFSGGVKRALMSLSIGNFLLSFRPRMTEELKKFERSLSLEWSTYVKGGKAVRLSGIFEKLNYRVRKALFSKSDKCSFSTAHCILMSEGERVANMHFLIQTISRDIPVASPEKSAALLKKESLPVSLQEQKEIYLLPTVRMTNLLHSEIDVILSETDQLSTVGYDSIGKQATIAYGSTAVFYANPDVIYFTVTLTGSNSSSKLLNTGECVKKLLKKNRDVQHVDLNLDFDGGKFCATLRLYRGSTGMLEVVVFTSYSMKNNTDLEIYVLATKRWPLSRIELDNLKSHIPSELGLCLPPRTTRSWFLKPKSVQLKLLEDNTAEALLDLDSLSGLTEISFKKEEGSGVKSVTKLGMSIGPSGEFCVPSQMVTIVPRYVICNESEASITVRQCYFQDEMAGVISIGSKQRMPLQLKEGFSKTREFSVFEHFIRKHRSPSDNSLLYIQFETDEPGLGWSGPVCIASLGHFFLKFRKQTKEIGISDSKMTEFAAVHVVEESSTLILSFYKPPNISLPYRIENSLHNLSITYYQKGLLEPEVLGPGSNADYAWDDLTLPHRLVVRINGSLQLQEIKLDKVRAWKPFYKLGKQRALSTHLVLDKRPGDHAMEMEKVGYEIYAEGPTRVLRICEISNSFRGDNVLNLCAKVQVRVSQFAVHLLEHVKQEGDENELQDFTPFSVVKLGNLHMFMVSNNDQVYNQFTVQDVNFELKWNGAPFASMLRRHQLDYSGSSDSVLKIVFILLNSSSNLKQFRYSSIFLQPIDLNLDEETLMKIASFWRTSLSDSESQRFYFDHFEIHPIKIIANFIPGELNSSYSSTQEALRSLIHSVVKVPPIKNMVVELNGVLITHALITVRELFFKCAQHYSWYAMRAIYLAKGSPLLPPDFVSIFDDLASSSLDVFFDPSRGFANLPAFTSGTFKLISKCIKGEGFSGTKRYFGDLGKTLRSAGSNIAFAAVAEISDSVLKGAEANGFNGLVSGFHQGILKLAMEPSVLGTALMEGGPDRTILLDRSPGVDELYIEGYIQAMLDTVYRQEYLRVRVIDNQVILKNLPPNHTLICEIMDRVKEFLVSKALLKGDPSSMGLPLRRLRGESEWRIGPTVLTLCEHLFVSFAIRMLRKQANKFVIKIKWGKQSEVDSHKDAPAESNKMGQKLGFIRKWGIAKFVLSALLAYVDGRLCRSIPNPVARRVVSGFLLSYIDKDDDE
ncbi:Vacuolar protein sorting-associated proteinb [Arachis hypogaea]|nr:Vacuolar protein sorting-associated proteinb [Arachis hypogaea]QHO47811.1 Vacuolar protein sorting-associated proteinb [Arachis hypogaea]QHO47812.1 Vacuolar protein sorting-associated proteinb [Arachis hypogaea]QHO47813.1 Vacuolar protein sorting-associated proteinb [Arachis hypogaea]